MRQLLQEKGIRRTAFAFGLVRDARHEEAAWARRIDDALEFLLKK